MNRETSPITVEHSPREGVIQRTQEQSIIGTCSKIFVETQNPRISLNHSCPFKNQIFEPELEGFIFSLSPDPLCLQGNDYQIVEDLHQLENHKYVDSIESWFQAVIKPSCFLNIRKLLIPYKLKM